MPILAYLVAKTTGAPMFTRYAISAVVGFACLFGLVASRSGVVAAGALVLLVFQIGIADAFVYVKKPNLLEPSTGYAISTRRADFRQRYQWMDAAEVKDAPVVLLNDLDALATAYYAPPTIRARLTYEGWNGSDPSYQNYVSLRDCCGSPLTLLSTPAEFLESHNTFLAFGSLESERPSDTAFLNDWIKDGATITVESVSQDHFLILVKDAKKIAHRLSSHSEGPPS